MSAVVDLGARARSSRVLVVGAGPAGLAVAACLKDHGLDPTILEQGDQVGLSWRRHYDRLHLHTERRHSSLPLYPLPATAAKFPSRKQVVDYLDDYAEHFGLRPCFGTRVERIESEGDGWSVVTDRGLFRAPHLVMTTGYNRIPRSPSFPGLASFGGPVLHSSEYTNGRAFSGQRVLVVGCGNSGAEIALDLFEHGARATLVVRSPIHVTRREVLGSSAQSSNILLGMLPVPVADFVAGAVLRWSIGDLKPWGIERPKEGPNLQIWKYGRVPLIDVGTIARIKDGNIGVSVGVESVGAHDVRFADGTEQAFDALVLATGFTTGLARLLPDDSSVLTERGHPIAHGSEAAPGLYFVGFRNPPTGALREIAREAPAVARSIARRERRARRELGSPG